MQRILVKSLTQINTKSALNINLRCLATQKNVFEVKSEFPARHIGPRKTDVVSMLDLLGFKVNLILLWILIKFLFKKLN